MSTLVSLLLTASVLTALLGLQRLRRPMLPALAERLGWAPVPPAPRRARHLSLPRPSPGALLQMAGGASLGYATGLVIFGDNLLAAGAALAGLLLLPGAWRRWQAGRRHRELVLQLERTLAQLSSSLRASASIVQAFQQVAADTPAPLGEALRLCVDLLRSGHTLEHALDRVRQQAGASEFDLVAVATEVSAELGANLAATYDRVAETLRERRNFRSAVEAQTAQGRYGALLVTLMPFLLLAFLRVVNPVYLAPLLQTSGGRLLVAVCSGAILFGWGMIRRIVDVRLD